VLFLNSAVLNILLKNSNTSSFFKIVLRKGTASAGVWDDGNKCGMVI
jgi:hypothetical protein